MNESNKRPAPKRSPAYPFVDLETAISRVKQIKDYAGIGRPIPVHAALKEWGYKVTSGAGHQQLAALIKYGLLEDEGKKDQRIVKVTERANRILVDQPGSPARKKAIREAALDPTLLAAVHDRWPHGLPSDQQVSTWLILEQNFNENAVPSVLKVIQETFKYAELDSALDTDDNSGDPQGPDESETVDVGSWVQWASQGVAQFPEPKKVLGISPDGDYAFVEGTQSGIPMSQLTVETPNTQDNPQGPPPNPWAFSKPKAEAGMEESRWKLPSGNAIVMLPATMTARDFKVLRGQIDLLEMSSTDDSDDE